VDKPIWGQRLAIVGSRSLKGNPKAWICVLSWVERTKPCLVISGGAEGVDTMAEQAADMLCIPKDIKYPKSKNWAGYSARNMLIAESCDTLLCIYDPDSLTHGGEWTADYAISIGKIVFKEPISWH
jgi:hypothetical protein